MSFDILSFSRAVNFFLIMQMDPQQEDLGKSNPLGVNFVLRKPILEVSAKKVVAIVDRVEQEYRMLYSKDLNFR